MISKIHLQNTKIMRKLFFLSIFLLILFLFSFKTNNNQNSNFVEIEKVSTKSTKEIANFTRVQYGSTTCDQTTWSRYKETWTLVGNNDELELVLSNY